MKLAFLSIATICRLWLHSPSAVTALLSGLWEPIYTECCKETSEKYPSRQ